MLHFFVCCLLFFLIYTAPTDIYTLSLHDALPICFSTVSGENPCPDPAAPAAPPAAGPDCFIKTVCISDRRSEEHTSELQSHSDLVCRLLLEKKKKNKTNPASQLPIQ